MAALASLVGVTATLVVALSSPAEAARHRPSHRGGGYTPPSATIVVDAKTGKVLEGENEDAPRIPASITKVMTLYLLFEQLERGRVQLDTELSVSAHAAAQPPTKLGLRAGSTIEVEDAIKGMVTLSANDASMVVAENLAGSEQAFAEMMTRKARALGMNSTVFYNPHGLPNLPSNMTTARDLSILGRAIQDRFPKYFAYFQTQSFQFGSRTIRGHNRLLGRVDGVDGIKTGYTRLSGFNLLTSVNTDTRSVVAVVLGGRSAGSRDQRMASLIESYLPRAYAGARIAPPLLENSQRPTLMADASPRPAVNIPASPPTTNVNVETTAAMAPPPVRIASATPSAPVAAAPSPDARKPLDLNSLRPVVASAAGASSTTTPSSPLRWQTGPAALPQSAQAYAPVQSEAPARPAPIAAKVEAKADDRIPAAPMPSVKADDRAASIRTVLAKADVPEPKREAVKPPVSGWMIQLGATDEEGKAKVIIDNAKSRSGRALARASGFTEKVTRDGTTLYRARFSGFQEADDAQEACKALKRSGFACFATRG
jgi:D-alanyl-D-alanine carboxypeptidase